MSRVEELKQIHAEGQAAKIGAPNPYRGQIVNAAVWMSGYRKMLDARLELGRAANFPANI